MNLAHSLLPGMLGHMHYVRSCEGAEGVHLLQYRRGDCHWPDSDYLQGILSAPQKSFMGPPSSSVLE